MPKITLGAGPTDANAPVPPAEPQEMPELQGRFYPEPDEVPEDETAETDGHSYEGMAYGELQAALRDRGLSATGKKDELIARLKADDEEAED